MSPSDSKFVWYELMTSDAPAAEAFYSEVVGWRAQDAGLPDRRYTMLFAAETPIGGVMAMPPDVPAAGAHPRWVGYVSTADVDDAAERVQQAGGAIHRAADDIPGVGRFAVVADPQGASFMLFKGTADDQPPQPAPDTAGLVGWHELQASELDSAFAFYASLFGWTKAEAVDMGPMGSYLIFAIAEARVGGMMKKMAQVPQPFWLYYFNVPAIGAAADRVRSNGGQVVAGPHQVPGGSWIVNCIDPQGAVFALVSMQA